MGRKVHPIGLRLNSISPGKGAGSQKAAQYREQLHQDFAIRDMIYTAEAGR